MKKLWGTVPRYLRYVFTQTAYLLLILLFFRAIFYFCCFTTTDPNPRDVTRAWYLGFKFDLRLALILMVPLLLLALISREKFFNRPLIRRIHFIYLFIVYLGLVLLYLLDLGEYSYLGVRLEPSILRFAASGERADNTRMLWQSYHVVRWALGLIVFFAITWWGFRRIFYHQATALAVRVSRGKYVGWIIGSVLLFAAGIYGNFAYFPLRWSQAMFTRDNAITSLALNPILYFTSNLSVNDDTFDVQKTRKYYTTMARYLEVDQPDEQALNYLRTVPAKDKPKLNVIMVMMESTGAAPTSVFNNPLQGTPHMKQLADSGICFENFYVPAISTAKTVYGVTTGLPDITREKTASRHPRMVDQRVVMDQFKGYEKYYLLGGNTNWANIRAVFTNNVDSIKIFEEGYYKSPKADVWGVSDYDLITEANDIFKAAHDKKQPFIAFLQLADNHPPYTTTAGAGDFKKLTAQEVDPQKLKASGFVSLAQFNAVRYEDYNIGHLMELAKKSGYLDHTLFVFFGDHNCVLNPYKFMPLPEYEMATGGVHVTAMMYSPKNIVPQRVHNPVSLLDMYPTVAGMVGMPYKNYTLGTDIFDSTHVHPYKFISYVRNQAVYYAVIGPQYLFEQQANTAQTALYDLKANPQLDIKAQLPDTARYLEHLTHGFYESTRYLMLNNKKG
ncbi:Phosphoglycerol transferase MdoB [Chitinophaga costaii]|uniref:Phosphoglycerol transferase MdoB n=1 Tax=Chitinophaga costaii TaxID=1335309 RepID=A0A1C3ZIG9_9BACT|nr:LTA synthase family protein [Chitinophaga costaii]PUZ30389.1 LTA synthase family protein [Chitinophaga costaii]SCB82209.1 Phosphoglycerol transferase MdoB [Chitinophaga costaii]